MQKSLYILSLALISLFNAHLVLGQDVDPKSSAFIRWGDRKLDWYDFQGPIPISSEFDALTNSAISLAYEGESTSLTFTIETIFDLFGSWKKPGVSDYVLAHEQVHFDITEYHSRLLRKKLKAHKFKTFASIEGDIRKLFDEAYAKAKKMQVKYDAQTRHSLNKKNQAKWNAKVKKLLIGESLHKSVVFKINISYITK